jgi:hypothetical protein
MARLLLRPPSEPARPALVARPALAVNGRIESGAIDLPDVTPSPPLPPSRAAASMGCAVCIELRCIDVGQASRNLGRPRITQPRRHRMDRRRATRPYESQDGVSHQLSSTSWTSAALIEQYPRPRGRLSVCSCCSRPSLDDDKFAEAELEEHNFLLPQACTGLWSHPCTAARSSFFVRCAQTSAPVRT